MCSPQDLPFLNPACSLRSIEARAIDILFKISLLNTLLVMDSNGIPLHFLQKLGFPLFCFLGLPVNGYFFSFPYFKVSVMTPPLAFSISALTSSAEGAVPECILSIVDFTSFAVGGSMLTGRSSSLSCRDVLYFSGCFFVEDGLEVRFPQLCLFFYTCYHHHPFCIFNGNVTVLKTSS